MICPKCKNRIDNDLLKCPHCNTKIATVCKKCGTLNPINARICTNCKNELLKLCTKCNSANLPNAVKCRKCGEIFKNDLSENIENNITKTSQQKAKSILLDSLKNSETSIITISGDSGTGKSLILRTAISELKNANILWLNGHCTYLTQLSPFGYFQDILLSFFNINNFCSDTMHLKKNSISFFKQDFPALSHTEILNLLNLLYPEDTDYYEKIYINKTKMFNILKKVFLTIVDKIKTVFIIDSFENMDGMSYDFIKELVNDEYFIKRCKFVILSQNRAPGLGLLPSTILSDENYVDIILSKFSKSQISSLISKYNIADVTDILCDCAYNVSLGNPSLAEQVILLYNDLKRNNIKLSNYNSPEDIMVSRLNILKDENTYAYRFLIASSVLGVKFYPAMLETFDNISAQKYEDIIEYLVQNGYIVQINNLSFEFKSYDIWKIIVSIVKNDNCFEEILNNLYEIISTYKQSSIALLGYIVQKLRNDDKALEIWTMIMKQASYIGDIGLYIISQKQALKLIENKTSAHFQKIKKNIYTRVGKLLEPINPQASFEYLQQAVIMLEDNEEAEHIELLGYIASCSMKMGNYWGAIECTDNILNKIPEDLVLEKSLIKSRQISPLVKLGNYGQVVNLIDTEIMPVFEKYLAKGRNTHIIQISDLYKTWIELYFDFAEALTFQGDSRMFDVANIIFEVIDKNKISDEQILCKAHLTLALANTVKGDIKTSSKILDDILKEYPLDTMNPSIISRWNFINILNKYFKNDYNNLYNELFSVVTYANNVNDNFTKNILKTILASVLKNNNNHKKALEILEEQVAYFAKQKIATGVLLCWYLISEIRLETKGTQFALDIATKALDIAQTPNVNNYLFMSLFNRLIGEIYLTKQDFESAKVYIEKSIFIAKQFGLERAQIESYVQYAKYYQELALPKTTKRAEYIKQALKMFQLAKNIQIVDTHSNYQNYIKKELSVLTSFCKLNGIMLKKNTK